MTIEQGDMLISQYFSKVRFLCNEIAKLDSKSTISEARKCRIIIYGLNAHGIVTTTQGWAKEPTLVELESTLTN